MEFKIQQIGNSLGIIIPKDELTQRGLELGDVVELDFKEDPFWDSVKKYSKEDRKKAYQDDGLSHDDFKEWENL